MVFEEHEVLIFQILCELEPLHACLKFDMLNIRPYCFLNRWFTSVCHLVLFLNKCIVMILIFKFLFFQFKTAKGLILGRESYQGSHKSNFLLNVMSYIQSYNLNRNKLTQVKLITTRKRHILPYFSFSLSLQRLY